MKLTSEQYANLIHKYPDLRPKIQADCHSHSREASKLKSVVGNEPLATPQIQKGFEGKVLISIQSYRRRLLDEDNLICKYHVDILRYACIIRNDSPEQAKIEVSQFKVKTKDQEEVIITITEI